MLFNSLQFLIFFLVVYCLYLLLNHKWQNRMLLVASCIFYGAWSWKFLLLMFVSISSDYICGIKIYESSDKRIRKIFLIISLFVNLFILCFFKYYDFFASNIVGLFQFIGLNIHIRFLHVILPIGISFYTFQAMSYPIDIYRRHLVPTRSFRDYALFVAYFPQLVAGPIMRAGDLLPQVLSPRKIRLIWIYEGICLILWGLFQKVFVADNLARIVDGVFSSTPPFCGAQVLIASYAFVFQVFCDFSGYSDIARGLGKMMGFEIMINFNLPLLATNIQDFWRRWHISLSSWVKNYIYIPLGGNRKGKARMCLNILITLTAIGLWHGASWHFIIFGFFEGVLLLAYRLLKPGIENIIKPKNKLGWNIWLIVRIVFMFQITTLGFILFRGQSMTQILEMLKGLLFNFQGVNNTGPWSMSLEVLWFVWIFLVIQIIQYRGNDLMVIHKWPPVSVAFVHAVLFYFIVMHSTPGYKFIYFQF